MFSSQNALDSEGTFFSGNQSEEYFKRMVEIKDKNIEDLLKELRETKQIYSEYKNQYLNEEKRMKAKLADITLKLEAQVAEIQKCRHANSKMKAELDSRVDRQKREAEANDKRVNQLKNSLLQIQAHNKQLKVERVSMIQKQSLLEQRCARLEDRLKGKSEEARVYEEQARRLKDMLLKREQEWKREKQQLIERGLEQEKRKMAKNKTNTRLDAIENKIKSNLMKI